MNKIAVTLISVIAISFVMAGCGAAKKLSKMRAYSLKFLDMKVIPSSLQFQNTMVRGLSGIDYNPDLKEYYIMCDDRSERQPSRYYTAQITLNKYKIDSFWVTRVDSLKTDDGRIFPYRGSDPESIVYDRLSGFWVWANEGQRNITSNNILQPTIRIVNREALVLDSFALPERYRIYSYEKGSRDNGTLESIRFTPDYRSFWFLMEEPLYEDGPRITTDNNNTYLRMAGFDRFSKKQIAEYAYQPDKVATKPQPSTAYNINGVSDMLFIDSTRFLVMERSYSSGVKGSVIKIFLANTRSATNVINMPSLANRTDVVPVEKKLLYNFSDLKFYIDNVEGITFGPKLPNGNRSVIFVSDDNFSPLQESQLYLFELIEP